jgi:hypothetical protein
MVTIHILFVVLFDAGVVYQIIARRKMLAAIDAEQQARLQATVEQVIQSIAQSSSEVAGTSTSLMEHSDHLEQLSTRITEIVGGLSEVSRQQNQGTRDGLESDGGARGRHFSDRADNSAGCGRNAGFVPAGRSWTRGGRDGHYKHARSQRDA